MSERAVDLVERLFDAFNRRAADEVEALCEGDFELILPSPDKGSPGRSFEGPAGIQQCLALAEREWEELVLSAGEVQERGELVLVVGRVYARSRSCGMRDLPAAWVWRLHGERFASGRAYLEPEHALAAVEEGSEPG